MMFESVSAAAPDPILGLGEAFQKDDRSDKVNLTIGVYKDEQGQTPILQCVKQAEQRILGQEQTKGYLGIDGLPEFKRLTGELLFGELVEADRVFAAQSPGGTGALKIAADFLTASFPGIRMWCSTPTWPNHLAVFGRAGLEVKQYPYLSENRTSLDLPAMLDCLRKEARRGDAICLHACCHNPTGIDPSPQQWAEIAEVTAEIGMLPVIDFAYHGFGDGLEEDRVGLKAMLESHPELFVCSSFSKNFGLYSERVGAVCAVCSSPAVTGNVGSRVKQTIRSNYSNPPRHGAAIVAGVLADAELRQLWMDELSGMRQRIHDMRRKFVAAVAAEGCATDFSFLLSQRGMFSFSGLTPMQVDWLRSEKGVYIVGSGRINVAGITPSNLPPLAKAIAEATRI